MIEPGTIECCDALDFLKRLPDKSVDLVLTDPPYGIKHKPRLGCVSSQTGFGAGKTFTCTPFTDGAEWDAEPPSVEYFDEIRRVSREQVVFGGNFYTDKLPPSRCWIVWDKRAHGQRNTRADCELVWTSFDRVARMVRYEWDGMLQGNMSNKETRVHPTQKPLPVMTEILAMFSQPGDLICDPFCGSGSTFEAAARLGRRYIGCDISPEWAEYSRKRMRQMTMFESQ